MDINNMIRRYEGIGVPYRDRYDDLRIIVANLCNRIPLDSDSNMKLLINEYKSISYIDDILISGNRCYIKCDVGELSFLVLNSNFFKDFCFESFGLTDLSCQCHNVTRKILELCCCDRLSAITSLCINVNYFTYFHSYIHDRKENFVIDFVRNMVMYKDMYDKLFCYEQINDLSYNEYGVMLNETGYDFETNISPLLYLALSKLDIQSNTVCKHFVKNFGV